MEEKIIGNCYAVPHGKGVLKVIGVNHNDYSFFTVVYVRSNPNGTFGNGIDIVTKSADDIKRYAEIDTEQFNKIFDQKMHELKMWSE